MIKVRKILAERTGYVGTLDPFATGVLPIAVGEARKFIRFIEKSQKKYVFTMVFGESTNTFDKTGKVTGIVDNIPRILDISSVFHEFIGEIHQIPPEFSAIKVNGRRACDRARSGEKVELSSRKVSIFDIQILGEDLQKNELCLEVTCSCGTYIRSLARDIAERLGSLAYVKTLRRTMSGFFSIDSTITIEKLLKMRDTTGVIVVPVESPLDDIPALYTGRRNITGLRNGVGFRLKNPEIVSSNVRIVDDANGVFCGIGYISNDGEVEAIKMCVNCQM
jgi:tRNA pseudouridine55 synthase